MHLLKIHFLRCINAVGCRKKRNATRCMYKMQAILSVYLKTERGTTLTPTKTKKVRANHKKIAIQLISGALL